MRISDLGKIFIGVQGSTLILANGTQVKLLQSPVMSGVTHSYSDAGSLAVTSNDVGSGYLFRSDGTFWVRGSGAGIAALQEDLNPKLGSDLDLNGHMLVGQVETNEFVIDGGLI